MQQQQVMQTIMQQQQVMQQQMGMRGMGRQVMQQQPMILPGLIEQDDQQEQ
jgi:hypothetical protein